MGTGYFHFGLFSVPALPRCLQSAGFFRAHFLPQIVVELVI